MLAPTRRVAAKPADASATITVDMYDVPLKKPSDSVDRYIGSTLMSLSNRTLTTFAVLLIMTACVLLSLPLSWVAHTDVWTWDLGPRARSAEANAMEDMRRNLAVMELSLKNERLHAASLSARLREEREHSMALSQELRLEREHAFRSRGNGDVFVTSDEEFDEQDPPFEPWPLAIHPMAQPLLAVDDFGF